MGRAVYKLGPDAYVEWSSVVDAPVTYVCNRKAAVAGFGESRGFPGQTSAGTLTRICSMRSRLKSLSSSIAPGHARRN